MIRLCRLHTHACLFLACLSFFTACMDVDYDFDGRTPEPQVTVNALISPQNDFEISLYWSGIYTDEIMTFKPVADAEIRLLEEGREVVRCTASPDGRTSTGFRASVGCSYRLEVTVPDYGRLTAETTVPEAPQAAINFVQMKGGYRHFVLDYLDIPEDIMSVWIQGNYARTDKESATIWQKITNYYTASLFVDQVNGSNDAFEADDKGSAMVFEEFIRIPQENSQQVQPLYFSVWGADNPSYSLRHAFRVITPSDAYDRYMRSRYKQQLNSEWSAEENPFIEQITVYTNISNGLGIFAGYNYCQTSEL